MQGYGLLSKRLVEQPCYYGQVAALVVCGEENGVFVLCLLNRSHFVRWAIGFKERLELKVVRGAVSIAEVVVSHWKSKGHLPLSARFRCDQTLHHHVSNTSAMCEKEFAVVL